MVLLKYFAKQKETNLPDPSGTFSREVPSSAIVSANKEVQKIASSSESRVVATDHRLHNTAS